MLGQELYLNSAAPQTSPRVDDQQSDQKQQPERWADEQCSAVREPHGGRVIKNDEQGLCPEQHNDCPSKKAMYPFKPIVNGCAHSGMRKDQDQGQHDKCAVADQVYVAPECMKHLVPVSLLIVDREKGHKHHVPERSCNATAAVDASV